MFHDHDDFEVLCASQHTELDDDAGDGGVLEVAGPPGGGQLVVAQVRHQVLPELRGLPANQHSRVVHGVQVSAVSRVLRHVLKIDR